MNRVLKNSQKEILYESDAPKNLCLHLKPGVVGLELAIQTTILIPFKGRVRYRIRGTDSIQREKKIILVIHSEEPAILIPKLGETVLDIPDTIIGIPLVILFPLGFFPSLRGEIDYEFLYPDEAGKKDILSKFCEGKYSDF